MRQLAAYINKLIHEIKFIHENTAHSQMADSDSLFDASKRVVGTHLAMFKDSCVVSAVEAWRIWNDFPEQRASIAMTEPLEHYGRVDIVLKDISLIMSMLVANGTLDDAFLLQHIATTTAAGRGSTFLNYAVLSSLINKYSHQAAYSDYGRDASHQINSGACGRCNRCESVSFMVDLGAYIARRRMSAL